MIWTPPTRRTRILATLAGLLGIAPAANAAWELNMTRGVTSLSHLAYDLHMVILGICTIIAVLVFGAMIYAIVKYRKSKGAIPDKEWSHSTTFEIVWTAIPTLILVFMAFQAVPGVIAYEDTRNSDMTIKITAYQWKWQYEYLGEDVAFFSTLAASSNETRQLKSGKDPHQVENYLLDVDQELVVPVGVKVRYLVTASDVLHAWWVPALGVKRDAIPGYVNEGWFKVEEPGTYRGQCAELCGKDHGFMPIVVKAVSRDEFDAWLAERKAPAATVSGA